MNTNQLKSSTQMTSFSLRGNGFTNPERKRDELENSRIEVGSLTIDPMTRSCYSCGQQVELTSSEFDLLWLLARNAGKVVNRDEIYTHLRGFEYNGLERSADLRVARLRKKLGESGRHPKRIKSVRYEGYLLTIQ